MPSMSSWVFGFTMAIAVSALGEDKPAAEVVEMPALTDAEASAVANVVRILDKEVAVDVVETPLEDVLQQVGKVRNIKITLDLEGLRKAGIAKNKLVTINEKQINLRGFLPKLLMPLGLTYRVRPDGLLITPLAPPPAGKVEPEK